MGGKGWRRREKNYREAHGGSSRLPPPPDASKLDALPSSLRKLISFTSSLSQDSAKDSNDVRKKRNVGDGGTESKPRPKDEVASAVGESNAATMTTHDAAIEDLNLEMPQLGDYDDVAAKSGSNEHKKKKKKRKRGQVEDLRFAEAMEDLSYGSKKREKKKKYLEAKKNKKKKAKTEDTLDFRRDKVEFGDVVQAPPKLVQVPKASKSNYSASQERIRLKAVKDYRKRRGWTSRPGIHLPSSVTSSSEL